MRLLPGTRTVIFLGWRHVDCVVQPTVPIRRHARRLGKAVVDDPAPLEAERWVDLAALGSEVAVARLVLAHELAITPGPELRAERLAVPPGEKAREEIFDRHR